MVYYLQAFSYLHLTNSCDLDLLWKVIKKISYINKTINYNSKMQKKDEQHELSAFKKDEEAKKPLNSGNYCIRFF